MERIEIPFNRLRVGLYSFILFLFVLLFAYIAADIYKHANGFWDYIIVAILFVFACLVILLWWAYFSKLISLKPGLVITERGVVNNTSLLVNWGLIEWKDVYFVKGRKVSINYLIGVETNEQEKYAARMNFINSWNVKNTEGEWGFRPSPIINASLLYCNPIELENTLNTFLKKYGDKASI